jgi:hypothetical protein
MIARIKRLDGKVQYRYVHQLVLLTFVGEPPLGKECRHLDGNATNNHLTNLKYGTRKQNMADQRRHGVLARGEAKANSRLSPAKVRKIRRILRRVLPYTVGIYRIYRRVSYRFKVSEVTIRDVHLRYTWAWVK